MFLLLEKKKMQSENRDSLSNSFVSAELSADEEVESIFASQKKDGSGRKPSSLKSGNNALKRDALLKKLEEWHYEDKNVTSDESAKKKHVKMLMDELLASAVIHRITFKYV